MPPSQESFLAQDTLVRHRVFRGAPGNNVVHDPAATTEEQAEPKQLDDPTEETEHARRALGLDPGQHKRAEHYQDRPERVGDQSGLVFTGREYDSLSADEPRIDVTHVVCLTRVRGRSNRSASKLATCDRTRG